MKLFYRTLTTLVLALLILFSGWSPKQAGATGAMLRTPHGMGLILPANFHPNLSRTSYQIPATMPTTVDLSAFLPPVGDQGQVGSCVDWAEGYYLRGWYANLNGNYPAGGFAPMSIYSYIVQQYDGGVDGGSTLEQGGTELFNHGIDPQADYPQGNYDYKDLPTSQEAALALPYGISGYHSILQPGESPEQAIVDSLANNVPVVLGFAVYPEYETYGPTSPPVPGPTAGEQSLGGHANIDYGYGPDGAYVENQWGAGWGNDGKGVLSWAYINAAVIDVLTFDMPPPPVPTDTPVPPSFTPLPTLTPVPPTNTPIPTSTPVPPTATPRPTPKPTPGLVPWPNPKPAPPPSALPKGTYLEVITITDGSGNVRAVTSIKIRK